MKFITCIFLAGLLCAHSVADWKDIPVTTFNNVTISAKVITSNTGQGYLLSVSEAVAQIPYVRLDLNLADGSVVTQLVANTSAVNLVFVAPPSPIAFIAFQEMGALGPAHSIYAPK